MIIAAGSRAKNASGARDREMSQTKKGNQCHSGMKGHIGVDAGTECMHSVTATTASVHHLDHPARLVRVEDKNVVAGSGH